MTNTAECPLCGNAPSEHVLTISKDFLTSEWTKSFQIDIANELSEAREIELRRCVACTLEYFKPDAVQGSPALYEALQKFDWYYMPKKWEHDVALKELKPGGVGLEIGCGTGSFIERAGSLGLVFEGCEQNLSAITEARKKGLKVHEASLDELAERYRSRFDAVCAFQVLEHVHCPRVFLEFVCKLLATDGKLVLGLPNALSFLRYQTNLLDMPPHHMTRWSKEVLLKLQRYFPLRLISVAYEPLAEYHIDGFVEAYAGRLGSFGLRRLSGPRVRYAASRFIKLSGFRHLLRGQTIYASYVRV